MKEINQTYKDLLKGKRKIIVFTQVGMIFSASIFSFVGIFTGITRYLDTHFNYHLDFLLKIIAIIISFIIVHYTVGYILLITSKIHKFLYKVEDITLKVDFICSYFITSTFLTVLLVFPDNFKDNIFIGLIMITICYYLNIKVLLTLMIKPSNVKSHTEDETSFARVMCASILLLIMLVFNLYLAVCFVNGLDNEVYLNSNSYFDLFYYTIITFTTIGYGDIIPTTIPAKIVAIVISITSVICLTVFLSSVLSYKDTFKKDIE
ncbi:MAG: ion channel [Peptostreptococcaceae bacterium]